VPDKATKPSNLKRESWFVTDGLLPDGQGTDAEET
jgi:hypothetical protein